MLADSGGGSTPNPKQLEPTGGRDAEELFRRSKLAGWLDGPEGGQEDPGEHAPQEGDRGQEGPCDGQAHGRNAEDQGSKRQDPDEANNVGLNKKLKEIVQDSGGDWAERISTITLVE